MFSWRARRWPQLLLLTVFVSGGLVGPWVHGLEHARSSHHERHAHAEVEHRLAARNVTAAESAPAPASFLVSERAPLDEVLCLLCLRQVVRSAAHALPAAHLGARGSVELSDARTPLAARLPARPIRAPPTPAS